MKRADRRDSNRDHALNYPRSRQEEPVSPHELKQLLATARTQRDEWKQQACENQQATAQLVQVQQTLQSVQVEVRSWQERSAQNHQLYLEEQQRYQQALCLYNEEQAKAAQLLTQYKEAEAQRDQYLTLYNEAQAQLKYERRSKAGIKGWETRRKAENERLKREIADMVVLLRESLTRKDEAVNHLYVLAERMDRIQQLVDSVEEAPVGTPMGLLKKLQRVWFAVKEILAE